MKVCVRCNESKSIFYKDKRATDGLYSHCSDCDKKSRQHRKSRLQETQRALYMRKKQHYKDSFKKWKNANVSKMQAYKAKWRKNNLKYCAYLRAKYLAAKRKATPSWLTQAHINEIKLIYLGCPSGYEVDHIEPLQGKDRRGLHVPWNLQYLTKAENRKKGNRT